jgi:hypothetical protein
LAHTKICCFPIDPGVAWLLPEMQRFQYLS